jgi:hypothetical protein
MAKIEMVCPFTQRLCDECPLYRGRHYYLCFCDKYRGYIGQAEKHTGANHQSVDFQTLWKLLEQRMAVSPQPEANPEVRLKVIDMESGEARFCSLEEAKTWDWDNPQMVRMIGGYFHVPSWEKLAEFASSKAKKGFKEVEVYEGPRFMMLAGG